MGDPVPPEMLFSFEKRKGELSDMEAAMQDNFMQRLSEMDEAVRREPSDSRAA